jgi:4'-phosphopantetheinyl transferase
MNKETLHLWFAYPDDLLEESVAATAMQLLSEEERTRRERFKFERQRREYLATHALARVALSHAGKLPPEAWKFQFNEYGKPSIDPECGLRFNLSNSKDMVVCLVSERGDVGVDVEPRERAASVLEVAPRMFSPQELAQLEGLREEEKPERALRLWTLKEAYIKARGMGLALPLSKFSFLFEGEAKMRMAMDRNLGDRPARWKFSQMEHAGHLIALMVESKTVPELRCWEARPPFGAPRRMALPEERWFPAS